MADNDSDEYVLDTLITEHIFPYYKNKDMTKHKQNVWKIYVDAADSSQNKVTGPFKIVNNYEKTKTLLADILECGITKDFETRVKMMRQQIKTFDPNDVILIILIKPQTGNIAVLLNSISINN